MKVKSTLWEADEDIVCLPPLTTTATGPDPTGTLSGIHWCQIFSTLIIGTGSGANVSLVQQTSSTDPTLIAIPYSPASSITCLEAIDNASGVIKLLVGRQGAAP